MRLATKDYLFLAVIAAGMMWGCASGGRPPGPKPTPIPSPRPTPTPTPVPTPTPTPNPCLPAPPVQRFEFHWSGGGARRIADATSKTCSDGGGPLEGWRARCSTSPSGCVPGGGEGSPWRVDVETFWGPYLWTLDGEDCLSTGACFPDNGNPLRVVLRYASPDFPRGARSGQVLKVTAASNGFTSDGLVVP